MEIQKPHELVLAQTLQGPTHENGNGKSAADKSVDAAASPFKTVVDPALRSNLKNALVDLISNHETWLAEMVAQRRLSLDSYKEYVELFARSLKETMETREGVGYLLGYAGFDVNLDHVNLNPEWRWKQPQLPA